MLLRDEQYVVEWLSRYGALEYEQVVRLLHNKTPATASKIIRNLRRMGQIHDLPGNYLSIDPRYEPEEKLITAMWILLRFIDKVEPMAHRPAMYPAQIYFLKEQYAYQIVVIRQEEKHLLRILPVDEYMKYIIVLPDIRMAEGLTLPNVPCMFATCSDGTEISPTIVFYGGADIGTKADPA